MRYMVIFILNILLSVPAFADDQLGSLPDPAMDQRLAAGSALNPAFTIEGIEVVLHPLETVSVATDQLGEKVATFAQEGDRITGAMDELLTRAWA